MSAATGTILGITGIAAAAGSSIAGGVMGSNAAHDAATTQAQAANQAAQLQYQLGQQNLQFQQQVYNQQQQNLAPWLQAGGGALNQLAYLLGVSPNTGLGNGQANVPGLPSVPGVSTATALNPGGTNGITGTGGGFGVAGDPNIDPASIQQVNTGNFSNPIHVPGDNTGGASQPWQANTALGGFGSLMTPFNSSSVDVTKDPGYAFRLSEGMKALEHSAAARGTILSGGTAKALSRYGQDYASNEYGNAYNRAFNEFQTNRNNILNPLQSLAGVGQTAGSLLNNAGQNTAGNVSSILMGTGNSIGNQLNNAAAATASGYVGGANAWGNALGQLGGLPYQYMLLNQLGGAHPFANTNLTGTLGVMSGA